ncbi:MAG: hypothetical protein COA58_12075 [Bacteroidetes bacterium]|nr:MAG: hypothetical protein COA58_12075 [Bacteroidota bacterium]
MKILTLISLILVTLTASAQLESFPTQNATWHNLFTQYTDDGSGNVVYHRTSHYYVNGKQTIDGVEYCQLYVSMKDTLDFKLWGLYRVEGEKVYIREYNGDFLFYDFGLEVGDTFNAGNGGVFTVQKVDSLLLEDGVHRIIDFGSASFIRGIGSPQGLFSFMGVNVSGFSNELVCFSKNGKALYPRSFDSTCYEITKLGIEKTNSIRVKVFPNPTNGFIHIEGVESGDRLELVDVFGRLIFVEKNSDTLDVRNVQSGIYKLIIARDNHIYTSNIVISR